jgi:fibronectin type 3 domain-containing protein
MLSPNITSYSDTGLTVGTRYYYKITIRNDAFQYLTSNVTDTYTRPAAPAIASVTTLTTSTLRVAWGAVTSATSYKVYTSTTSNGTYSYLGTTSSLTYDHTGLSVGTAHYYKVSAVNAGGEGAQSAAVGNYTLPAAPAIASVTALTTSTLRDTWGAVTSATSYKVYTATTSSSTFVYLTTTAAQTYDHRGWPKVPFIITRFRRSMRAGKGRNRRRSATTLPAEPTGLVAAVRTSHRIDLAWSDNSSGESGYRIYRSTDGTTYTLVGTAAASTTFWRTSGLDVHHVSLLCRGVQ